MLFFNGRLCCCLHNLDYGASWFFWWWKWTALLTFVTPWTAPHQAPLSMGFPRQNTGVHCHFLLQGIFLTQGSTLDLLNFRWILYGLRHQGSPSAIVKRHFCFTWPSLGSVLSHGIHTLVWGWECGAGCLSQIWIALSKLLFLSWTQVPRL